MRREIVKLTAEESAKFREAFELREDLKGDPIWEGAYKHASQCKLWPDELTAIGEALVRRPNGGLDRHPGGGT